MSRKIFSINTENFSTDKDQTTLATLQIQPIVYTQGITKTKDIIPAKKERLGKGHSSQVFEHRYNESLVIKKSGHSLEKEYEIGLFLDHPHLVKMRRLYLKQYPTKTKYKLVIDKIHGQTISRYYRGSKKLSNEIVNKLFSQVLDCCLYLFKQKVGWADVNDGNIYVLDKENNLMLADFDKWRVIEDSKLRAWQLLLGSMEIVGWIVRSSSQLAVNNHFQLESEILFPQEFFEEKIDLTQILSIFGITLYAKTPWFQKIQDKITSMNDNEIMQFFIDYFNNVNKNFNRANSLITTISD